MKYKMLLFDFKGVHGMAPGYISELLQQHTSSRPLRSVQRFQLTIPKSRLKLKGLHLLVYGAVYPSMLDLVPPLMHLNLI